MLKLQIAVFVQKQLKWLKCKNRNQKFHLTKSISMLAYNGKHEKHAYEKHASFSLKTIDKAIKLVEKFVSLIQNNLDHIRHDRNIGLKSLNGPEGSISAATVNSIHLLDFGMKQLKNNTKKLGYRNINLRSFMTLSLENLHSTVNDKHATQTVLTYAQSFASSMKESVKRLVEWVKYYFTSREIWYLCPKNTMKLEEK